MFLAWPLLAHVAAWVAFLWIAIWPFAYQGVSVQEGSDGTAQVTHVSASFVEENGIWALLPMTVPVVLTGLAFLAVWRWSPGRWAKVILLWLLALAAVGFCVLGMLSFGILFVPAALALLITAIVGAFQATPSNERDSQPIGQ